VPAGAPMSIIMVNTLTVFGGLLGARVFRRA
jgi:hypothetical protein